MPTTRVRAHVNNGHHVRSHVRRTRGAASPARSTTRVRAHVNNGHHVRAHHRGVGTVAAGGGGFALLVIVLAFLAHGGDNSAPATTHPPAQPSVTHSIAPTTR